MHRQFKDLAELEPHVPNAGDQNRAGTLAKVRQLLAGGHFILDVEKP
jgi:hypothetical protein